MKTLNHSIKHQNFSLHLPAASHQSFTTTDKEINLTIERVQLLMSFTAQINSTPDFRIINISTNLQLLCTSHGL